MPILHDAPPDIISSVPSRSRVTFFDRWLTRQLLERLGDPPIAVTLWNGEQIGGAACGHDVARVHIAGRRSLLRLTINPSLGFGDAFSDGDIAVEGNLTDLCNAIERSMPKTQVIRRPRRRRFQNDLRAARNNIHRHYDIGNDFYRLWLDDQLVYSCAYFEVPDQTLAAAQTAKLDYVCRKLRLKSGQFVVEAGCGWGALALHMARYYGVRVRAYNISREQIHYAHKRAAAEGLASRVEFIEDDWRNIAGQCDAFVSVGMLEHVGPEHYEELGETVRRSLRPTGLGLIHTIGRNRAQPLDGWTRKRIFPGANPPSLRQMMDLFEQTDFSVLDVENLRLHYARTLELWLEQFEANVAEVRKMFDDRFVRMWRLYLSASIPAFRCSSLQLFQVVFCHAANNDIPWTRRSVYTKGLLSDNGVPLPSIVDSLVTDACCQKPVGLKPAMRHVDKG